MKEVSGYPRLRGSARYDTLKLLIMTFVSGSNLSQGQRQLLSLARALLAPSSILVLDEATAAVDMETDGLLQTTLRSPAFRNRTIITIAHRINTILDSDRVVVLEAGEVKEFDSPQGLIKKRGLFYQLVREAGLLERRDDQCIRQGDQPFRKRVVGKA